MLVLSACDTSLGSDGNVLHPPPPFYIRTLQDFKNALNANSLNAYGLVHFLKENGYPFNIRNRTQFDNFIGVFYEIGYPTVDNEKDIQKFTLEYAYSSKHHMIIYEINGVSYSFTYVADPTFVEHNEKDKAISRLMDDVEIDMYHHLYKDKYACVIGDIYIGDYRIRVRARYYSSLDDIDLNQFTWQKAQ